MASSTSNEKEIRELLTDLLNRSCPDSFTFDEFSGGALSTRPDLATFSKKSIIFSEIKSDKDVLTNLPNQIKDYRYNCDYTIAVLDYVHYIKWIKTIRKKCTPSLTLFYKDGKLYHESFNEDYTVWSEANILNSFDFNRRYNTESSNYNVLYFLWKQEKLEFLKHLKGKTKILSEIKVIERLYTYRDIIDIAYAILYDRMINRNAHNVKMQYNSGTYKGDLINKERTQEDFKKIECIYCIKGLREKKLKEKKCLI